MRRIYRIFLMIIMSAISVSGIFAQTLLSSSEREDLLKKVIKDYSNWGKVEIKGKLSSPKLPVNPNVKIYMERNKCLQISLSAPFVGEVARVEYYTDSITIVNKLKHKYARIGTNHIDEVYPGFLKDFQATLLGRVSIMGQGQLRSGDFNKLQVYANDSSDGYILVPDSAYQPSLCSYGYTVTSDGETNALVILLNGTENILAMQFERQSKELTLDMSLIFDNQTTEASLMLNAPKIGGKKMEPFEPTARYRKVRIGDVL